MFKTYLPLCSLVSIVKTCNNFSKIKYKNIDAYIPSSNIQEIKKKFKDWVLIAEKLLHTPYKWGGRNACGIDCSSLLQLSLLTKNFKIPRDTIEQIVFLSLRFPETNILTRGSVVFWKGHVAIGIDSLHVIHSSGHHFKVVIERFENVTQRLKSEGLNMIKMIKIPL